MTAWGASMMRARAVTEEATTREEEEEEDAAVVRERRFATLALDRPNASGTETESEEEEMFARPRVFVEMELRESAEAEKREALRARDVNAEPTRRDGGAGKTSVAGRARASRVDAAMEFDEYNEDDVDDWDDDVEEPREDAPRASSGARAGGGLSRMGLLPARNIAETHPWRSRLPHFVPVTELAPQSFHEGELVHVDYLAQFGGPRPRPRARVPHPRVNSSPTAPQNPHPRAPSRLDGTRMSEASKPSSTRGASRAPVKPRTRRPKGVRVNSSRVSSPRPPHTHTHTRARVPWYHIIYFIKLQSFRRAELRPSNERIPSRPFPSRSPAGVDGYPNASVLPLTPRPCARACYTATISR